MKPFRFFFQSHRTAHTRREALAEAFRAMSTKVWPWQGATTLLIEGERLWGAICRENPAHRSIHHDPILALKNRNKIARVHTRLFSTINPLMGSLQVTVSRFETRMHERRSSFELRQS